MTKNNSKTNNVHLSKTHLKSLIQSNDECLIFQFLGWVELARVKFLKLKLWFCLFNQRSKLLKNPSLKWGPRHIKGRHTRIEWQCILHDWFTLCSNYKRSIKCDEFGGHFASPRHYNIMSALSTLVAKIKR